MAYKPKESKEFPGWYEIPEFSKYLANEFGFIKVKKTGYETKGGNAGPYLKVGIYKDGNKKHSLYYVHDLICRAFYGLPSLKIRAPVVLHADDNKRNNTRSNLSWGSQSQNIKDVWKRGLRKSNKYSYENIVNGKLYIISNKMHGYKTAIIPSALNEDIVVDELIEPAIEIIEAFLDIESALMFVKINSIDKNLYIYSVDLEELNPDTVLSPKQIAEMNLSKTSLLTNSFWLLSKTDFYFEKIVNINKMDYEQVMQEYHPYGKENLISTIEIIRKKK